MSWRPLTRSSAMSMRRSAFGLLGLAVGDDGFEATGGGGKVVWRRRVCGVVGVVVGKLGLLGVEVFEAGVQARGDALLAALEREAALLEGLEVALGRAFGASEDRLGLVEGGLVDQRLVGGLEVLVGSADAPDIGRVGEDAVDGRVSPAGRGCGSMFGA
jgi:hypothetical protein